MFSTAAISLTLTLLLNLVDQEYIEHSDQNLKETNSCGPFDKLVYWKLDLECREQQLSGPVY